MEKIINNVWNPGSKIPLENELCINLGVCRHTIRAVLNKLNALGLFETNHDEGAFVKKLEPSRQYILTLLFLLFSWESINIEQLWNSEKVLKLKQYGWLQNVTEENIAELQLIEDELTKNKDYIESYAEYDIDFHVAISKASKNQMFLQTMNIIKVILSAQLHE